jgi:small-conductance mechanosensitive channel
MEKNKKRPKWPLPVFAVIAAVAMSMSLIPGLLLKSIAWLLIITFWIIMFLAVMPRKKSWYKGETAKFLHELSWTYLSGGVMVSLVGQLLFWIIVKKQLTDWLIGLTAMTALLIAALLSIGRYQRDGQFIPGYALGLGLSGLLISDLDFAWPALAVQAIILIAVWIKRK